MRKLLLIGVLCLFVVSAAFADNFSFTGNFTRDDNVQLFTFSGSTGDVITLRTYSYAGGVNSAGQTIARGGFDPILALFGPTGNYLGQNDDGGGAVPADSVTGAHYDTYLQLTLSQSGTFTVSVMEYDNFARQPTLADGFIRDGQGNFTAFGNCPQFLDVRGSCRDSHWAFDILGATTANQEGGPSPIPEPASLTLLGTGLIAGARRLRKLLAR